MPTTLVSGADRGLGHALCAELLDRGWRVYAGQFMPAWPALGELATRYPDTCYVVPLDVSSTESVRAVADRIAADGHGLDLLISNAGISHHAQEPVEGFDDEAFRLLYDVNTLGGIRLVDALLLLMDESEMKRLCFVSSEAGSVTMCQRTDGYAYCMSKTALNMAVRIMHNDLYARGYTFRLYHPGWMKTYMGGTKNTRANLEPEEAAMLALAFFLGDREDEGRLVLTDNLGCEWSF